MQGEHQSKVNQRTEKHAKSPFVRIITTGNWNISFTSKQVWAVKKYFLIYETLKGTLIERLRAGKSAFLQRSQMRKCFFTCLLKIIIEFSENL